MRTHAMTKSDANPKCDKCARLAERVDNLMAGRASMVYAYNHIVGVALHGIRTLRARGHVDDADAIQEMMDKGAP